MKRIISILSIMGLVLVTILLNSCQTEHTKVFSPEESRAVHDRVLTVDTHCDTPMRMVRGDWNIAERHEPGQRGSGLIDLPRMKEGGLDALFFAVFIGQGPRTPEATQAATDRAFLTLNAIHKMCEDNPEVVGLALTPDDAYRLEKEGKRAAFIGMENGYPIGTDLSLVEKFYDQGVRYITLCHSSDNDICDSSTDRQNPEDNGLTEFGQEVVAECNRLGIMIDLSHTSDQTFFDVIEYSKAPVIASHSCVRALCDAPRNLSDDMLKLLAEKKGVIQITLVSSYLRKEESNPERDKALQEIQDKYGPRREIKDETTMAKMREEYMAVMEKYPRQQATLKDLVDHIDYAVDLIGIDHVGIGTDFDGGGSVEGCSDVSQMYHITEELLRRGYSEIEIQKIWGGNIMRVFNQVIKVSHTIGSEGR
ncbi:MAG: dipeptidase [Candidatus Aminicenantes bacterium]|nr:dipeptidase [Candidatus Aminicenantes bacterium]